MKHIKLFEDFEGPSPYLYPGLEKGPTDDEIVDSLRSHLDDADEGEDLNLVIEDVATEMGVDVDRVNLAMKNKGFDIGNYMSQGSKPKGK